MAIPYEAAVATIQSMFENVDKDVICTVLEANSGHMEKTVECLLAMSGEIPAEEQQQTTTTSNSAQIKEDEQLARMLQNQLFLNELKQHHEFDDIFFSELVHSSRPSASGTTSQESDTDLVNSIKQLGASAKLKFRELAMRFSKNRPQDKPDVKYAALNNSEEDDDTEVVAFDSSLAKRTPTKDDSHEDSEVPLTSKRNQSNNLHHRTVRLVSSKKDD